LFLKLGLEFAVLYLLLVKFLINLDILELVVNYMNLLSVPKTNLFSEVPTTPKNPPSKEPFKTIPDNI